MSLSGKRALVTGASQGLGPAIAEALAKQGAWVAVNHRASSEAADRVASTLPYPELGHFAVAGDVTSGAAVEAMMAEIVHRMGGVDILVNNTGPYGATPISEVSEDEWDRIIDANLKGAWLCTRAVASHMRSSGWGRVINISAVSGQVRNRGSYGLAKASLETMTETLAVELGASATVNAVAPGQILESLEEMRTLNETWATKVTQRTPRGRLVARGEVAEVVATLCSGPFESLTGTTLYLDGGLRLNRF